MNQKYLTTLKFGRYPDSCLRLNGDFPVPRQRLLFILMSSLSTPFYSTRGAHGSPGESYFMSQIGVMQRKDKHYVC